MKDKTKRILLFCLLGVIVIFGIIFRSSTKQKETLQETQKLSAESDFREEPVLAEESIRLLGIHVTGAVQNPDKVYYLPEGARVADAIEIAGGAVEGADLSQLNLAAYVKDGQRIRVPFAGESLPAEEAGPEGQTKHLTNINSATKIELIQLPGIGDTTADKIIAYREEHGGFSSIEELMNVPGIGQTKFESLKDLISVDDND